MSVRIRIALPPALASLQQQTLAWWRSRVLRERQMMVLVLVVLGLFAGWTLLVQPAWHTLREAPAQLDLLDSQLHQMQGVATESQALRAIPPVSPGQAGQALTSASDRLGERGKLTLQGDRATLKLTNVSPDALRAWLSEARSGARARPVEAQLQRAPSGYSGMLVVTLGGEP